MTTTFGTQLTFDLTSTQTQEPTMTDSSPTARAEAFAAALTERYSARHLFTVTKGRKNHRIVMTTVGRNDPSVHAFVDSEGNVYKADGWSKPATGIRARVHTDEALNALIALLTDDDWAGGYLYRR